MRVGVWLVSGTALGAPYPCRCSESRDRWACANDRCPCRGRTDLGPGMPPDCCAWTWPGLRAALLGDVTSHPVLDSGA